MVHILIGFAIVGAGFLLVWKTEPVFEFTGTMDWFEEKLGSTRLGIKLTGVGVIVVGLMTITGLYADVLNAFAGMFVRQPKS